MTIVCPKHAEHKQFTGIADIPISFQIDASGKIVSQDENTEGVGINDFNETFTCNECGADAVVKY